MNPRIPVSYLKDGQLLPANPDTSIGVLRLNGNRVTGTGTDVSGVVVTMQGRWENGKLELTYEEPSMKFPVNMTGRFEGTKLALESRILVPRGKNLSKPYGGKLYDYRDLVIVLEGVRKDLET
jgi:hypothetical protein